SELPPIRSKVFRHAHTHRSRHPRFRVRSKPAARDVGFAMNALMHWSRTRMETCPNHLTDYRAGSARGLHYHRTGSARRLRRPRAGAIRRPRRLSSRLGKIAIALVVAMLIFIGGQWLLLEAPASGFELGLAAHATDAVAGD